MKVLKKKLIQELFFSYCFVFGYSHYYSNWTYHVPNHSIINLILWIISFSFLIREDNWYDIKEKRKYWFVCLLLSIALLVGKAINETNSISVLFNPRIKIIGLTFSIAGFIRTISPALRFAIKKLNIAVQYINSFNFNKRIDSMLNNLLIIWGILFFSWIPTLLALYPGVFSYDSNMQTKQVLEGISDGHHPPLHTLFWGLCMKIGYHFKVEPLLIYSLAQMFIFSLCLAFTIWYLKKKNIANWFILLFVNLCLLGLGILFY